MKKNNGKLLNKNLKDAAEEKFINIFSEASKQIPAYKDFLKKNNINFEHIKKISQYKDIPLTTKQNYIEQYSIVQRVRQGQHLSNFYMICTSSGSTGNPTIWPRGYERDEKAIISNTGLYSELFDIGKKKTLIVVTFGLGAWTAGMLTSRLVWEIGRVSNNVSVVTPGLNKEVSLKIIQELSQFYDQTIITGYPPFIIELIDYGIAEGFDFKKINTKIHYTSARLLEEQRNELVNLISNNNERSDVLGFYASSEFGIIGVENSDTVQILDWARKDQDFSKELFGAKVPPTFTIYDPNLKYIEVNDGTLIITADQPVPLIRYDTRDRGGVFNSDHLNIVCKKYGYKSPIGLLDNKHFLYIYGRKDAVRLLCNIYIDDIQYCIENSSISGLLTSNFKYGLVNYGLKNRLKVIVFNNINVDLTKKQKEVFKKEFYTNLSNINPDFKMVSEGISFPLDIFFKKEKDVSYQGGKISYFL